MNLLFSLFEGLCDLALGAVVAVCGFDREEFEEEE